MQQVEIYDNGKVLAYDESHVADEHGQLADQPLDMEEMSQFEMSRQDFAAATRDMKAPNR
jgi:hypothetical protein